jgi:hypothetical protein
MVVNVIDYFGGRRGGMITLECTSGRIESRTYHRINLHGRIFLFPRAC